MLVIRDWDIRIHTNIPSQVEIMKVWPHGARRSTHRSPTAAGAVVSSYRVVLCNRLATLQPGREACPHLQPEVANPLQSAVQ